MKFLVSAIGLTLVLSSSNSLASEKPLLQYSSKGQAEIAHSGGCRKGYGNTCCHAGSRPFHCH